MESDRLVYIGEFRLRFGAEHLIYLLTVHLFGRTDLRVVLKRQVIRTEHHILGRHRYRLTVLRLDQVVRREHEESRLGLSLRRQRKVNRHLVAVEVGVKRGTYQRVQLERLALDQHRLERFDTQSVQGWRAV